LKFLKINVVLICFLMFFCLSGCKNDVIDSKINFAGEWHRTDVWSSIPSTLIISNVTENGFDFIIEAYYWSNSGYVKGKAKFMDNTKAVPTEINDFDLTDENFTVLEFIMINNILTIPGNNLQFSLPVGMNVTVDGEYIKSQPEYTNTDNYRKIIPDDETAAIIENLLGYEQYNNYFIYAAQNGIIESAEVEGYPGYLIQTATLGGLAYRIAVTEENIVYIWQDGWGDSVFYCNK